MRGIVKYIFCSFLLTISLVGFAQKPVRTVSDAGEGITFENRSKEFSTTIFGWTQVGVMGNYTFNQPTFIDGFNLSANINRLRLGSKGNFYEGKLKYLFQVAFAGNEVNTPVGAPHERFNGLLDAYFEYELVEGLNIGGGQRLIPSNLESMTSERNLGLMDRSNLSKFSGFGRDIGIFASYKTTGNRFGFKVSGAVTQGEGRNYGDFFRGGLNYTGRLDVYLINGREKDFENTLTDANKLDGTFLKIGGGYSFNDNASRENVFTGDFVNTERDVETIFADVLFKTNGFSFLGEFVNRYTEIPVVYDTTFNIIANFNTGWAINGQVAYCLPSNLEIISRFTMLNYKEVNQTPNVNEYAAGINYYLNKHYIKFQSSIGYADLVGNKNDFVFTNFGLLIGF